MNEHLKDGMNMLGLALTTFTVFMTIAKPYTLLFWATGIGSLFYGFLTVLEIIKFFKMGGK
jgi:hypothetical protein